MRPVNLIPPEERRGSERTSTSTGALAYAIVGLLVIALAAVAAMTYYGNQINESKSEIADIEGRVAAANARAQSLTSFTSFQELRDARVATIDSLAQTRFDWQRVLRELARIIPKDVAITNVTGTATPSVVVQDEAGIGLRDSVPGPALEVVGCSQGQRNVARFIAAIHDIDGVTRVTATEGVRGDIVAKDEGASDTSSGTCGRSGDSAFEIVAAFDAIPVPEGALPSVDGTTPVPTSTEVTGEATAAVPEASAQQAQSQAEVDNAQNNAADATNLNPAG